MKRWVLLLLFMGCCVVAQAQRVATECSIAPTTFTFPSWKAARKINIQIQANGVYVAESNASWLTIGKPTNDGAFSTYISVTENTGATRVGVITVTAPGSSLPAKTLTVTQPGSGADLGPANDLWVAHLAADAWPTSGDTLTWRTDCGWFDIDDADDATGCAATAANLLHWWSAIHAERIAWLGTYNGPALTYDSATPSTILTWLKTSATDVSTVDGALKRILCEAPQGTPGAFLRDVLPDANRIVTIASEDGSSSSGLKKATLATKLRVALSTPQQAPTTQQALAVNFLQASGERWATIWGARVDGAGAVTHLFLSEGTGDTGGDLRAVPLIYDTQDFAYVGDQQGKIKSIVCLSLADEQWEAYLAPRREQPVAIVSTAQDIVNPLDQVISLREALTYAASNQWSSLAISPTLSTTPSDRITLTRPLEIPSATFTSAPLVVTGNGATLTGAPLQIKFNNQLTLTDMTFTGSSAKDGGALFSFGATVAVSNVTFRANTASGRGGAVCAIGGRLHLYDVTCESNTAADGGAIYTTGTLNVQGGTFTNNVASSKGGALYVAGASQLTDLTCITNRATYGGAIYAVGETTATSLVCQANEAVDGGALYHELNTLTVTDATFTSNVATDDGGAFYNDSGAVTFTAVSFVNNRAETRGHAIAQYRDALTLRNTSALGTYGDIWLYDRVLTPAYVYDSRVDKAINYENALQSATQDGAACIEVTGSLFGSSVSIEGVVTQDAQWGFLKDAFMTHAPAGASPNVQVEATTRQAQRKLQGADALEVAHLLGITPIFEPAEENGVAKTVAKLNYEFGVVGFTIHPDHSVTLQVQTAVTQGSRGDTVNGTLQIYATVGDTDEPLGEPLVQPSYGTDGSITLPPITPRAEHKIFKVKVTP